MFDAHNHFTNINSILCTGELLPQFWNGITNFNKLNKSEIGMDKRYNSIMSEELQKKVFKNYMVYSKEKEIPVTIHCVHMTEEMLKILKEVKPNKNTVIWHGFNGSIETAKEINKLGILISIGPNFNKDIELIIKSIPIILLETDYEGTSLQEHNGIIENMYKMLSKRSNKSIELIEESCINATKVFKDRITFR